MDRLFLDANVLFSAAYRSDGGLTRLWRVDSAQLISSSYAVHEARRNLHSEERLARLDRLLGDVTVVTRITLPDEIASSIDLPRKDRPILAGALAARATHLITGDRRHFGAYFGRTLRGIEVLTPARYLRGVEDG